MVAMPLLSLTAIAVTLLKGRFSASSGLRAAWSTQLLWVLQVKLH